MSMIWKFIFFSSIAVHRLDLRVCVCVCVCDLILDSLKFNRIRSEPVK